MSQITSFRQIRGLDTSSNILVGSPGKDTAGAARSTTQIADNCVLSRQRMMSNRKGFDYFTKPTSALVDWIHEYQGYLIEHQADNTLWRGDPSSGARTQYSGSYAPPTGYRPDAAVARGNYYLATAGGVMKLDSATGTILRSGVTKGLDVRASTVAATGSGFMNGYCKTAYRVTWLRQDANNQQVRSDVSSRYILTNNTRVSVTSITISGSVATVITATAHGYSTGNSIVMAGATGATLNGTKTVTVTGSTSFTYSPVSGTSPDPGTSITAARYMDAQVTTTVPADVATGDSYEIWRTICKDASNSDPGDELFLVSKITNTQAAGTVLTFTDRTPDSVIINSTPAYTNASQEGALAGNSRPPQAVALAAYKDYLILGNCALDHQFNGNLLALISLVAGTSKLLVNNTAGQRAYTFDTAENLTTQRVLLSTGGVSVALNIELTVRSLCAVINADAASPVYAEYTSGPNDNPGLFRLFARSATSGAFWLTVDTTLTGTQFSPSLPTAGANRISSNDARANRLFYSKFQQPDAVPVLNYIDVGRLDQPILRVLAVRDACYIIKADGIYYLSGQSAPFSVIELDSTCHCVAPATAVSLNNQIYMLSNQGVVRVSTSGVTVVSFDIENIVMGTILPMPNLAAVAHGVAHEADRHYMLWLPSSTGDTYATQTYVFHAFVQEWTRWTKPAASGWAANTTYALYVSSGLENAVLKQRRDGSVADYSDETQAITVVSQANLAVTLTWSSTAYLPQIGMTVHQGSLISKATAVAQVGTSANWIVTIDRRAIYTAGAATVRLPIQAHVRLSPNTLGGEGGMVKSIYSVSMFVAADTVTSASIEVATNEAPIMRSFPITRAISGGFGLSAWGGTPWGDSLSPAHSIPFEVDLPVPDNTGEWVVAGWLHNVSQEPFSLVQAGISFDNLAEYETS